MGKMHSINNHLLFYFGCITIYFVQVSYSYPIESKPLSNNPDTWFGDEWLIFSPRGSDDPSALPLIGHDFGTVKKSKITPKSIFIAPNTINHAHYDCPSGYRVDNNGKCIKVVKINQDELLAARISELFKIDEKNKTPSTNNADSFADYYDSMEDKESSGPLQINIPLTIDLDQADEDAKRVEYVVENKITSPETPVYSFSTSEPKQTTLADITTPQTLATELPTTTELLTTYTEETITSTFVPVSEEPQTETTTSFEYSTSTPSPFTDTTIVPTSQSSFTEMKNEQTSSPLEASTSTVGTSVTTIRTPSSTKLFSVDFLPKPFRKSSLRQHTISSRMKNYRDQLDKKSQLNQPDKLTMNRTNQVEYNAFQNKRLTDLNSTLTRSYLKKPSTSVSQPNAMISRENFVPADGEIITTTTAKPFWWLPNGWRVSESKDKPTLVRFWSQQPLIMDERARSRSHMPSQRLNSRMPTGSIFHEMTLSEMDKISKTNKK